MASSKTLDERMADYKWRIMNGLMTINDARRAEGLPPIDHPDGDVYFVQMTGVQPALRQQNGAAE